MDLAKILSPIPLISSLFSTPEPPAIAEPALMPDPDDKALKARKRREVARIRQRSGRASTVDTEPLATVLG